MLKIIFLYLFYSLLQYFQYYTWNRKNDLSLCIESKLLFKTNSMNNKNEFIISMIFVIDSRRMKNFKESNRNVLNANL